MTTYAVHLDPTDSALPHNQGQYSVQVSKGGDPLEILHLAVLPGNSIPELEYYLRGKGFKIDTEIEAGKHYTLVKTD